MMHHRHRYICFIVAAILLFTSVVAFFIAGGVFVSSGPVSPVMYWLGLICLFWWSVPGQIAVGLVIWEIINQIPAQDFSIGQTIPRHVKLIAITNITLSIVPFALGIFAICSALFAPPTTSDPKWLRNLTIPMAIVANLTGIMMVIAGIYLLRGKLQRKLIIFASILACSSILWLICFSTPIFICGITTILVVQRLRRDALNRLI